MVSLNQSIKSAEAALMHLLTQQQAGVDDRTGKGASTEALIEEHLIRPYLPSPFRCQKGAVVCAAAPNEQSAAIDRVIYDPTVAPPLVYGEHSIFPIEAVAGLVEITMRVNATKLRQDIDKIAPVQNLRRRRVIVPVEDSTTNALRGEIDALSPRAFLIGLPDDPNWQPKTIANAIRETHLAVGGHVKVHGVYIIGVGYFSTVPASQGAPIYRVFAWTDDARLFRFANAFRTAFQRWPRMKEGWSADLDGYVAGPDATLLAP